MCLPTWDTCRQAVSYGTGWAGPSACVAGRAALVLSMRPQSGDSSGLGVRFIGRWLLKDRP